MSEKTGGPAFPREDYQASNAPGQSGMTLRDYFAAKAMQSLVAQTGVDPLRDSPQKGGADYARVSYFLADAMLAERAK